MCGALRASDAEKKAVLMGWVNRRRDLGNLIFIDVRDRTGITQVVFHKENNPALHQKAGELRNEYVIAAIGAVKLREPNTINKNIGTGEIELIAEELRILNEAKQPQFLPGDSVLPNEELRLKYRYIDLRRDAMQFNIELRHKVAIAIRDYLSSQGFFEIETPFMTRSTPEGARDYLVPSRVQPGYFYALPQSPQLFKQILMISGFDKYFQIVKCFRDEDLRADRQPEFTQVDIETSFPSRESLFALIEGLMVEVFSLNGIAIPRPLPRMSFQEAMDRYGSDKPDTRFDVFLQDFTDIFKSAESGVFREMAETGNTVRGLVAPKTAYSRKQLDDIALFVKQLGGAGVAWIKIGDDGINAAPMVKKAGAAAVEAVIRQSGARKGGTIFLMAGATEATLNLLGALRLEL